MDKAIKSFIVLSLLFFILSLLLEVKNKDVDFIFPTYPLATYSDSKLQHVTRMILSPNQEYRVYAREVVLQDTTDISTYRNTQRYTTSYAIRGDLSLWCSLNMARAPSAQDRNIWLLCPIYGKDLRFLPYLFLVFSFIGVFILLYRKIEQPAGRLISYCGIFFMMWIWLMLFIFYFNGFYIIYGIDPDQFINMAKEWLQFERHTRICNSIGAAFLYMPFILLCKPDDFFDIAILFSIFNFIFSGAGSLLLIIFISRAINESNNKAVNITASLAVIMPFTAWVLRQEGPWNPDFWGKTLFLIRNDHPYSMIFYNKSLLFAWNGMSDNIAVFFMLLGMFLLLYLRFSFKRYFLLGLVLGFSMCVRYGSFTILPAVFLYDIISLYQSRIRFTRIIQYYIVFAISGLLAFSPQLIDNLIVNGSFFAPSVMSSLYRGEERISNLMSVSNLFLGYFFFLKVHFKICLLYTIFLFVLKDRKLSFWLWLWIVAPLTFYSSLNFNSHSEIRYIIIIFPALYLIIGKVLGDFSLREITLVSLAILPSLIFASPESTIGLNPLNIPYWLHVVIPFISCLFILCMVYLEMVSVKKGLIFVIYFALLGTGIWWLVLLGMGLFPVWILVIKRMFFLNCAQNIFKHVFGFRMN